MTAAAGRPKRALKQINYSEADPVTGNHGGVDDPNDKDYERPKKRAKKVRAIGHAYSN